MLRERVFRFGEGFSGRCGVHKKLRPPPSCRCAPFDAPAGDERDFAIAAIEVSDCSLYWPKRARRKKGAAGCDPGGARDGEETQAAEDSSDRSSRRRPKTFFTAL